MANTTHEVTKLLADWSNGDQLALGELMQLVEGELRQMAHRYMARQNPGHTLQTTALINEAFVKLIGQPDKHFQNREHFFGVAASAMRHILVDFARSKQYSKRGGGAPVVSLDEALTVSEERAAELVALDDALKELVKFDARKAQVVELRFFGGLSVEETAKVLNISEITVMRDWSMAKSWLHRELSNTDKDDA
ncbi:MAG TPA: sigma-70 family RNA polymerase sigma factor [Blastocatellia bacterium]|nr:sigma-70 family RNA polymerase sigma factor [Blastocatellia bacterium]